MKRTTSGFTIVELLIVIVVIAILAALTVVAFNGINQRAVESSLSADLSSASKQIQLFNIEHGSLPTANSCPTPSSNEICLKPSAGTTFSYSPNLSTTPQTYTLTATHGSTSLLSMNGAASQKSYGPSVVSLTNLVVNGDFSNGLANWTNYCIAPSTCSVAGGVLAINADPTQRAWLVNSLPGPYNDGDKIFYSAAVRKDSGGGMRVIAARDNGGYDYRILHENTFTNMPVSSEFTRYSGIRDFVASQGTFTSVNLGYSGKNVAYKSAVDNVVAINLTSAFGAGNEPTATEMQNILQQFPNSFFSGTVTATY